MARIFKIAVLIIFTIMLGISVFGQDENSQSNKLSKRTIKKEAQRQALERLKEEHEMELLRLKQEVEQQIPCSDFQDDKDFIYATYKGQNFDLQMARRVAMDGVQSELRGKLSTDERYKELMSRGISYNINKECEEMLRIESGYIVYIAISVARKDLDKYLE